MPLHHVMKVGSRFSPTIYWIWKIHKLQRFPLNQGVAYYVPLLRRIRTQGTNFVHGKSSANYFCLPKKKTFFHTSRTDSISILHLKIDSCCIHQLTQNSDQFCGPILSIPCLLYQMCLGFCLSLIYMFFMFISLYIV